MGEIARCRWQLLLFITQIHKQSRVLRAAIDPPSSRSGEAAMPRHTASKLGEQA